MLRFTIAKRSDVNEKSWTMRRTALCAVAVALFGSTMTFTSHAGAAERDQTIQTSNTELARDPSTDPTQFASSKILMWFVQVEYRDYDENGRYGSYTSYWGTVYFSTEKYYALAMYKKLLQANAYGLLDYAVPNDDPNYVAVDVRLISAWVYPLAP